MSLLAKFLPVVLTLVALSLQGCGCDTDKATTCANDAAAAVRGDDAAICTGLDTYTTCIKDSGCCSEEGVKAALDQMVSSQSSKCTGDNALSSSC
mmetsp:Transcript_51434/g.92455  ORF Transcript_51434/g.92455 Transcript_51434/m.92455 type:complete len:95 (-) Transcript_51434:227-511(-)